MPYTIMLYDLSGMRTTVIDRVLDVRASLAVNTISKWQVTIPRLRTVYPNLMVEVWRDSYLLTAGWVRDWDDTTYTTTLKGVTWEYVLSGRDVHYAAGSPQAAKAGYADDLMKAVVRENLGSGATSDRQVPGLTVQVDSGVGAAIDRAFSRRNVLDVLQDFADESYQRGTRVYFGVRGYLGSGVLLEFYTRIDQLNDNRSFGSAHPTVFGETLGNLEDYIETHRYEDHFNVVHVGGQGLGDQRLVEEVVDTAAMQADPWARREIFTSYTSELSVSALTSAGKRKLREGRWRDTFSGSLIDTNITAFGRDWKFGDRVAVVQNRRKLDGLVNSISVQYQGGRERVRAAVGGNLG